MNGYASDGRVLIVPARAALLLARGLKIREVADAARGQDRELDGVLRSWLDLVADERERLSGSESGTLRDSAVPPGGHCDLMDTKQVAKLCTISDRSVRKAALRGTLVGVRAGRGWAFAPADVAEWRAKIA